MLVDSRRAFVNCANHALASVGVAARPAAELHPFLGPPLHATFAELADASLADACVAAYRRRYQQHAAAETDVFPALREALSTLDDELIVVTSKPAALAEPLLRAVGLRELFAAVFGPSLSERAEPKETTLARALDVHRPRALVGDRHLDITAARTHGLRAVGVLWGIGTESELRTAGADAIAATPADLPALLAR